MSGKDSSNISWTNWAALEAIADEEIDYSDIPPLTNDSLSPKTLLLGKPQP